MISKMTEMMKANTAKCRCTINNKSGSATPARSTSWRTRSCVSSRAIGKPINGESIPGSAYPSCRLCVVGRKGLRKVKSFPAGTMMKRGMTAAIMVTMMICICDASWTQQSQDEEITYTPPTPRNDNCLIVRMLQRLDPDVYHTAWNEMVSIANGCELGESSAREYVHGTASKNKVAAKVKKIRDVLEDHFHGELEGYLGLCYVKNLLLDLLVFIEEDKEIHRTGPGFAYMECEEEEEEEDNADDDQYVEPPTPRTPKPQYNLNDDITRVMKGWKRCDSWGETPRAQNDDADDEHFKMDTDERDCPGEDDAELAEMLQILEDWKDYYAINTEIIAISDRKIIDGGKRKKIKQWTIGTVMEHYDEDRDGEYKMGVIWHGKEVYEKIKYHDDNIEQNAVATFQINDKIKLSRAIKDKNGKVLVKRGTVAKVLKVLKKEGKLNVEWRNGPKKGTESKIKEATLKKKFEYVGIYKSRRRLLAECPGNGLDNHCGKSKATYDPHCYDCGAEASFRRRIRRRLARH